MRMFFLDSQGDFMRMLKRAFLAREIIIKSDTDIDDLGVWATNNSDILIDVANCFLLIENRIIYSYDFIWIANLQRFLFNDISYRQLGPDEILAGLNQFTFDIEDETLDLFLYPWHNFPELEWITT